MSATIFAQPLTHTYGAVPDKTVFSKYDTGMGALEASVVFGQPLTHTYGAAADRTVFTKYDTGGGMAGCGCGPRYDLKGLASLGEDMTVAQGLKGLAVFGAIGLGAFVLIGALKKAY